MAFINFGKRTIGFKIVYYGPGKSGKTTNLEQIHAQINPDSRGDMTILSTREDRTLFFDFLPLRSNVITGFTSNFQMYTVPGQVIYNQTRKLVLQGVDAIIFVADSDWTKMEENAESFANLKENLREHGKSIDTIPLLLQFNKRDIRTKAPLNYMNFMFNNGTKPAPSVEAIACEGKGVFESLNIISRLTLAAFMEQQGMQSTQLPNDISVPAEGSNDHA